MQQKDDKKILWHTLAFMAFSTVWGFGNVINGFSEYGGLKAIVSWILIFAIYFVPYALMVGELGSTFKHAGGGVSSWIHETIGPKMAYYAGWTYWVVHMPYISQKPNSTVIAASWALFQDKRASGMNTTVMQILCLVIFLFAMYLSGKGMGVLKRLATLAGSAMFIMSMLFIVMMVAAPALTDGAFLAIDWSPSSFIPDFNANFFLSLSILVFAVGGCEKISPYVNKMKDPSRDFAKGMVALAAMVAVTAILGTIALGMMFDSNHIPQDLMTNGAYYAFQKLGEYYHAGNFFVVVYALTNLIGQFSVMVLSVDAPLRMLLDSADSRFIPGKMFEKNEHGTYVNGHRLGDAHCLWADCGPCLWHQERGRSGALAGQGKLGVHAPAISVGLCGIHCLKKGRGCVLRRVQVCEGENSRHPGGRLVLSIHGLCMPDRYLLRGSLPAGSEYRDSLCAGRTWVHYAMDGSKGEKKLSFPHCRGDVFMVQ